MPSPTGREGKGEGIAKENTPYFSPSSWPSNVTDSEAPVATTSQRAITLSQHFLREEVSNGMHRERDREIRRRRKRREKRHKARVKELKTQAKKA